MSVSTTRHAARACAIILAACFAAPAFADATAARQPAPATVTPLASTGRTAAGQPIVLPREDARVIASLYEIAAGATLPVHKHPFPRYAYMLSGELAVTNVETGETVTYRAGDFIVEMVDIWHQGTGIGAEPVRLLVIDQVQGDAPNTLLRR